MKTDSFSLLISKSLKNYKKTISIDSDKSISIRSFLIGSISEGVSTISNVLESEDVFSTINCLKKLGVKITKVGKKKYKVFGKGLGSLKIKKNSSLNFGNSGTLARLILGIVTSTPDLSINVHGDSSLNKRNMSKLIALMNKFGAKFIPENKKHFPLKIVSSNFPIGISYEAETSAQLKSAVIFAALNSFGNTTIKEKVPSRDHTENMLKKNSQTIKVKKTNYKLIKIFGKNYLGKNSFQVAGDPSTAAFFTALTLLKENTFLKIKNVGLNPTRVGFYNLLKRSGAKIKFMNVKKVNNEKIGDIIVKSSKMKPIVASKKFYYNTTDEYPILFIISALINGKSYFSGISDLANKESNRITEMQKILKQIGVKSKFKNDILTIEGKKKVFNNKKGILVKKLGDHRICMSSVILALVTGIKIKINSFETVKTSSPNFLNTIKYLGGKFEKKNN